MVKFSVAVLVAAAAVAPALVNAAPVLETRDVAEQEDLFGRAVVDVLNDVYSREEMSDFFGRDLEELSIRELEELLEREIEVPDDLISRELANDLEARFLGIGKAVDWVKEKWTGKTKEERLAEKQMLAAREFDDLDEFLAREFDLEELLEREVDEDLFSRELADAIEARGLGTWFKNWKTGTTQAERHAAKAAAAQGQVQEPGVPVARAFDEEFEAREGPAAPAVPETPAPGGSTGAGATTPAAPATPVTPGAPAKPVTAGKEGTKGGPITAFLNFFKKASKPAHQHKTGGAPPTTPPPAGGETAPPAAAAPAAREFFDEDIMEREFLEEPVERSLEFDDMFEREFDEDLFERELDTDVYERDFDEELMEREFEGELYERDFDYDLYERVVEDLLERDLFDEELFEREYFYDELD